MSSRLSPRLWSDQLLTPNPQLLRDGDLSCLDIPPEAITNLSGLCKDVLEPLLDIYLDLIIVEGYVSDHQIQAFRTGNAVCIQMAEHPVEDVARIIIDTPDIEFDQMYINGKGLMGHLDLYWKQKTKRRNIYWNGYSEK